MVAGLTDVKKISAVIPVGRQTLAEAVEYRILIQRELLAEQERLWRRSIERDMDRAEANCCAIRWLPT
jgi:hypothetical protein